jgi:hypothetical protein
VQELSSTDGQFLQVVRRGQHNAARPAKLRRPQPGANQVGEQYITDFADQIVLGFHFSFLKTTLFQMLRTCRLQSLIQVGDNILHQVRL